MELLIAPLQGFTDSFWRRAHSEKMAAYGVRPVYFAPFARIEKGMVRPRDLREMAPAEGINLIPQAIFRDADELARIADAVETMGYRRLDLNMGCPFPPQTKAGRGAAAAVNPKLLDDLRRFIESRRELEFTAKMRPGLQLTDEWEAVADLIDALPLKYLTIHPRAARQQYRGEPDTEAFASMYEKLRHRLVYNGDVRTPHDFKATAERFPDLAGIMAGRGVLARPSLPVEIASGEEWDSAERRRLWAGIMKNIAERLSESSAGTAQAMDRLRPRLEYYEEEAVGRKEIKRLAKTRTPEEFISLLTNLIRL